MKVRLDYITAAFSSLVYVPPREETAVGSGQECRLLYVLCLRNRDIVGINSSCNTENSLSRETDLEV